MEDMNYEKDMQIDPDALDIEWLGQASLASKYGRCVIDLRLLAKQLEEKVKIVRSELIRTANETPKECCQKEKPNAADIEAFYRSHKDYKQVVEKLQEAQYELEFAEVAKNEICYTRKSALENLVVLHGQQYFAGPRIPRNLSREWETKQKQIKADNIVGGNLKRRKKAE